MAENKANPPPLHIPPSLAGDREVKAFLDNVTRTIYLLWKRTGGGSDSVFENENPPSCSHATKRKDDSAPVYPTPPQRDDSAPVYFSASKPDDDSGFTYLLGMITGLAKRMRYSLIPSGVIVIWSGSTASIPQGFVICDGSNGTPDLRDKFIVGAGSTYAVDDTGGAVDDTLNITTDTTALTTSAPNDTVEVQSGTGATVASQTHTHTINAHNHTDTFTVDTLPPYHALAFIMKL